MIKLYFDENVPEAIAVALKLRGYDVLTVKDVRKRGLTDTEQLEFASMENRAIFTFNVADFCDVHSEFVAKKLEHSGVILSKQLPIGIVIKAFLKLLSNKNPQELRNNVIWLTNWIAK